MLEQKIAGLSAKGADERRPFGHSAKKCVAARVRNTSTGVEQKNIPNALEHVSVICFTAPKGEVFEFQVLSDFDQRCDDGFVRLPLLEQVE